MIYGSVCSGIEGKITRAAITAACDSADDPESLRELLNIDRAEVKKIARKASKSDGERRYGYK